MQSWEPVGVAGLWGQTLVHDEFAEVGGFRKVTKGGGGFGKEVLGRGIRGEDMETFPKDPFETVKARIVRGNNEREVMCVLGGQGD